MLTNSSAEVDSIGKRFELRPQSVKYVPMHTTIKNPTPSQHNEGYVLAAGRSLRDYATLVACARSCPNIPFRMICGMDDRLNNPPPNVTVHQEVARDTYLSYLDRCTLVAVPLIPTDRATGQVVILEAMAMGKPVIATLAPGSKDLIVNGETGLLVNPADTEGWTKAIQQLFNNPAQAKHNAQNALQYIQQECSYEVHAKRKLQAIESLWLERCPQP